MARKYRADEAVKAADAAKAEQDRLAADAAKAAEAKAQTDALLEQTKQTIADVVKTLDAINPPVSTTPPEINVEYDKDAKRITVNDNTQQQLDERIQQFNEVIRAADESRKEERGRQIQSVESRNEELLKLYTADSTIMESPQVDEFKDLTSGLADLKERVGNTDIDVFYSRFQPLSTALNKRIKAFKTTPIENIPKVLERITALKNEIQTSNDELNRAYDQEMNEYKEAEKQYDTSFAEKKSQVMKKIRSKIAEQEQQLSSIPEGIPEGKALLNEIDGLLSSVS
jgi:hypothetical protein